MWWIVGGKFSVNFAKKISLKFVTASPTFRRVTLTFWESLNGGLANGGLRYLSTIVHDCLRLSSFCDESAP